MYLVQQQHLWLWQNLSNTLKNPQWMETEDKFHIIQTYQIYGSNITAFFLQSVYLAFK